MANKRRELVAEEGMLISTPAFNNFFELLINFIIQIHLRFCVIVKSLLYLYAVDRFSCINISPLLYSCCFCVFVTLTLSWRRPLSYRNQSTNLLFMIDYLIFKPEHWFALYLLFVSTWLGPLSCRTFDLLQV